MMYFFRLFCCAMALSTMARADDFQGFTSFLDRLKSEMVAQGVSHKVAEESFALVDGPIPRIIELDRNQPEFKLTLNQYMERAAPAARITKASEKYNENKELLLKASEKYQVDPAYILALWGIETDFGRVQGGYQVVPALVTLVYDGRRAEYFKKELREALAIIEAGHVGAADLKGSWAGAMGQCQFMPSSFNRFAVDANGDGRKDIWKTQADVFSSIANYLSQSGWKNDETWGRPVLLPANFDRTQITQSTRRSIQEWQNLGVRRTTGKDLPSRDLQARIIAPEGDKGPAYMVYGNYETILKWNKSDFFALAVGKLADGIGKRYTQMANGS